MLISVNGIMIEIAIKPEECGHTKGMQRFFDRVWMTIGNISNYENLSEKIMHNFILSQIWNNIQTLDCHYYPKLECEAYDLAKDVGIL